MDRNRWLSGLGHMLAGMSFPLMMFAGLGLPVQGSLAGAAIDPGIGSAGPSPDPVQYGPSGVIEDVFGFAPPEGMWGLVMDPVANADGTHGVTVVTSGAHPIDPMPQSLPELAEIDWSEQDFVAEPVTEVASGTWDEFHTAVIAVEDAVVSLDGGGAIAVSSVTHCVAGLLVDDGAGGASGWVFGFRMSLVIDRLDDANAPLVRMILAPLGSTDQLESAIVEAEWVSATMASLPTGGGVPPPGPGPCATKNPDDPPISDACCDLLVSWLACNAGCASAGSAQFAACTGLTGSFTLAALTAIAWCLKTKCGGLIYACAACIGLGAIIVLIGLTILSRCFEAKRKAEVACRNRCARDHQNAMNAIGCPSSLWP